jgi:molybdate transport system substrate-binding protein
MRAITTVAAAATAVLTVTSTGCQAGPQHPVAVFAAASLAKAFTALGGAFIDSGTVELTVAGSADLLTQLLHGADADVFAAADVATMDKAATAGLLDGPARAFATNTLTIVVPPGNPQNVTAFRDLARVSTVVCARQVPCGTAIPGLESQAGVQLSPVSEESSVSGVLNKVTSGQADAGLVYRTDARAAGDTVTEVRLPGAPVNTYQIAAVRTARDPQRARLFVDLVTGSVGRRVLAAAGFGEP